MNKGQILTQIKSVIFPNDENLIDAQKHQDLEVAIVEFLYDTIFAPTDVVNFAYDLQLKNTASIISEAFTSGLLGSGVKLYNDNDSWKLEIDEITVRKVMNVFELLINKYRSVNGGLIVSPGNGKVKTVTLADDVYTLEIEGDMTFAAGDLVRCQTFRTTGSKYYWVPITSVSGSNITVAASSFTSSLPEAGDELVQLGNTTDTSRQDAIIISASGDGAPSIKQYAGISSESLEGKEVTVISPTENKFTGTFTIKSSGKTIETALADTQNAAESAVKSYVDINFVTTTTYNSELTVLKNSIDAKASETEVSGLATRVSSAELKITSDAINLTVSSQVSAAQSSAIATANGYADTAIANMQIGGTNLIPNGHAYNNSDYWFASGGSSTAGVISIVTDPIYGNAFAYGSAITVENFLNSLEFKVKPSTQYTFAITTKVSDYVTTEDVWLIGRKSSSVTYSYDYIRNVVSANASTGWQRFVLTFMTNSDEDHVYLRIDNNGSSTSGTMGYIYVTEVSMYTGSKDLGWSANVNDSVLTTVYQSGITALQNSIALKVSQTDFNALGTRVSSTESAINLLPGTIDARITTQISSGGSIYNAVAASLTLDGNGISLFGKTINISGATIFSSLATNTSITNAVNNIINWTVVTDAIDLNSTGIPTTTGKYKLTGTLTNSPVVAWAYLTVEYIDSSRIIQTIRHDDTATNTYYARFFYGSAWSTWVKMTNADDLSSAKESLATSIGYSSYADLSAKAGTTQTLITGGKINTTLIEAVAVVANGLSAQTINANNATLQNLNVNIGTFTSIAINTATISGSLTCTNAAFNNGTFNSITINTATINNATVSGTLNGVTGTFNSLKALGSNGTLRFSGYGSICVEDDDFQQQGTKSSRSLRYYSANIRCRGSFGASSLNMVYIVNAVAYYYIDGYDQRNYVAVSLQSTGNGGYYVPLYPSVSSSDGNGYAPFLRVSGNTTYSDISGFPVDLVVVNNTGNYRYHLVGNVGKEVTLVNTNNNHSCWLAKNGNVDWELIGGKAQKWINLLDFMTNPTVSSSTAGAGWFMVGEYDNDW